MAERVPQRRDGGAKQKTGFFASLFQTGGFDVPFVFLVMFLFAVGVTMLYSASYPYAAAHSSNGPNAFFYNQLKFGLLGFAAMLIISKIDYRILNSALTPIAFGATVLLLLFTYVWNVIKHNDIKRWLEIGGVQLQPSEIAKFVMVLTLSYVICILYRTLNTKTNRRVRPNIARLTSFEKVFFNYIDTKLKATVLLALIVALFCGLVLIESHLSCTILLFLLGVSMMWISGVDKKWFVLLFIAVAAILAVVIFVKPELVKVISNYGYERIMVWKTKADYGGTTRWQTEQGLYAIGSGGPFGVGFGNSKQKHLWLPEPQNDFIFCIVVEELGYIGGALIVLLFALLIIRGFIIATRTRDLFGALLVAGIMMQVGLQVMLNIAVVTDVIPNTGIGLPFFSYGGTALFLILCEMGVVLSVSRSCAVRRDES